MRRRRGNLKQVVGEQQGSGKGIKSNRIKTSCRGRRDGEISRSLGGLVGRSGAGVGGIRATAVATPSRTAAIALGGGGDRSSWE